MSYQDFANLPAETRESFLAGYLLPEIEMYAVMRKLRESSYDEDTIRKFFGNVVSLDIEAVKDGLELNAAICFVYSADSMSDYDADVKRYDSLVSRINEKYGEIAHRKEPGNVHLGLIGDRKSAFTDVTTIVRNSDKTFTTTVKNTAQDVKNEDAVVRAKKS